MALKLTNNAKSTLSAGITNVATAAAVQSGDASLFPILGAGDWFPLTIVDGAGNMEIVKVTARSGPNLTIVRAQEGTTAQAWNSGDSVSHRPTAGSMPYIENGPAIRDATANATPTDTAILGFWDVVAGAFRHLTVANLKTLLFASPALTGNPTAPTPSAGDNDTSIATTGFVALSFAPLASPALSGNPTAPTPSPGDNDTSIATTGFVKAAIDVVLGGVSASFDTLAEIAAALTSHTGNTSNPHSVTKAQVGLGSVDNTADSGKPVSTAQQTALNLKADGSTLSSHTSNTSNPHSTTKAQVGLGSVDNTADAAKSVNFATTATNATNATNASNVPWTGVSGRPNQGLSTSDSPTFVALTLTNGIQTVAVQVSTGPSGDAVYGTNFYTTGAVDVGNFTTLGNANAKSIGTTSIDSSRNSTGSVPHLQFYNPNGLVGSIRTSASATSFNTSSDQNLKENFRDFDAGTILDQLSIYRFDWKTDDHSGGYGVKAQEAVSVFPDAVSAGSTDDLLGTEEYERWSVDYSKFVPLLLREIQELRRRVATLEAGA